MKYATAAALVFVLVGVSQAAVIETKNKVRVDYYYESKCAYCQAFTELEFWTAIKDLSEYVDVHLYPFGNAKFSGKTITCQYGPAECYGNKIHACAAHMLKGSEKPAHFIYCMESFQGDQDSLLAKCSALVGLNPEKVKTCANGKEGLELVTKIGHETLALKPKNPYVPLVALDGYRGNWTDEFLQYQIQIQENFPLVLCQEVKAKLGIVPGPCQTQQLDLTKLDAGEKKGKRCYAEDV